MRWDDRELRIWTPQMWALAVSAFGVVDAYYLMFTPEERH